MINEATNKCDSKKAIFIVPWAGKLHKCCEEHAKQLQILGSIIGEPVDVQPIITPEKCYQMEEITK